MNLVTLTERAKKYLNSVRPDDGHVTLSINGGGCAGFGYDWSFENEKGDKDLVVDDILFIDKMYELYILGMQLDYKNDIFGANFVFNNPKAKSSCGCGTSFSI